ncbi:NAD(P)/FAD-dependent oxidoreductase [Siminovitchia sp. 179-K 8D1 HS]|uniref:NAD(P)/FAD-dependent oxidoreductase n=1 Tax=Siminovitchia sp. 179-K 8D1 HS TaxID=3142385 RepID=UPI0039A0AF59
MKYELVIIGAGITGIQSALKAYEMGLKDVLIVDYHDTFGGFSNPLFNEEGFELEKKLVEKFNDLPYEKWTKATVTGLFEAFAGGDHVLNVQTPTGTFDIMAEKIIICSGALEKPREAHKIDGTRPAGVMTPTMAAELMKRGFLPGKKVAVLDNSKTSRAVAALLSKQGLDVIRIQADDYEVHKIYGKSRVDRVDIKHKYTEQVESLVCDSLIFSKGFIPSTFFLKGTGIALNDKLYVVTDHAGKTSVDNILAFGHCTDHHEVSCEQIESSMKRLFA